MPVWLTLRQGKGMGPGHRIRRSTMPLSSPAYSPASWTGEESAGLHAHCRQDAGTFMPPCKVEYTTVETACAARKFRIRTYRILKRDGSVFSRGNTLFQKTVSSAPFHPELFCGRRCRRWRMQPHTQEIPACFPYTDEELTDYMDKAGLGTVSTRTNIIIRTLRPQIYPLFGQVHHPDPKGLLLYETVRGMKVAEASPHLRLGNGTGTHRAGELTQKEFLDGVLETVNEVTGEIFRNHPEEARPHGSM